MLLMKLPQTGEQFQFLVHELHKIMSCQKEKFNFIDGVDEKGEPARDCRRGCLHTLQEVPFFFFRLPDARKVTRGGKRELSVFNRTRVFRSLFHARRKIITYHA